MSRKAIWLVTVEMPGQPVAGWTERNHFKAAEAIQQLKGTQEAATAQFGLFRLSLVGGKIYANRINLQEGDSIPNPRITVTHPKPEPIFGNSTQQDSGGDLTEPLPSSGL